MSTDPFRVLDIPQDASDEDIKKAYLRKVREFPPERASEQFQEVRAAYELIGSHRARIRHQLFHHAEPSTEQILGALLQAGGTPRRPSAELLKKALAGPAAGGKA